MKALRFDGSALSLGDAPVPRDTGEALIRVTLSGICNTDLEIVRGYAGFQGTIGHEFAGVVEEAPTRPELVGERVVGEINAGCGHCEKCRAHDPRHCPSRTVLGIVGRDGAHAEFLRLPAQNLVKVPENVADESAVFVEPLAAAWGITERVTIGPDTSVAVIGDGKLGLLCAISLSLITERLMLIGKHESKLAIAAKRGIKTSLRDNITPDAFGKYDVVVDASGSPSGFAMAIDLVRPKGTIVLKSTFNGSPRWEASRIVVDEISVIGSRCGRFEPALELLSSGKITVEDLISAEYPLSQGVEAMQHAASPGVLKVLLRP